jgi:hypothetical protein
MSKTKLFTFLAGLILGFATLAGAAQSTTPAKTTKPTTKSSSATKPMIHHMMGTVDSVTDTDLVLDHQWKGKKEQTKFTLDSQTKKEGDIAKGSHATVYYEFKNHQREATEVKLSAMKSPTKAKTAAKKS